MSEMHESIQNVEIPRNYFNRSKSHYLSLEVGKIVPVYTAMLIPNDLVKLRNRIVVRQQPTISPSFSNYVLTTRTFVVALRNLDKNIYRYLSGYKEYSTQTKYQEPLKYWDPYNRDKPFTNVRPGSLWDYLGYPTDCIPDDESLPLDYPRQAYNYIWDLYFRNQTIQNSILVDGEPGSSTNTDLLNVNWNRDYFTTALPFQQLSDPIGLPITGDTKAQFNTAFPMNSLQGYLSNELLNQMSAVRIKGQTDQAKVTAARQGGQAILSMSTSNGSTTGIGASDLVMGTTNPSTPIPIAVGDYNDQSLEILNQNIVSLNNVSSVLISDLRYAFALQLYAEMMARGGIRDNEWLLMMYGVAPTDETLGRPYYLGGSKTNVITSEVLQTSQSTDSASLGELGGHGLGVSESEEITYRAKEYAILMTLAYIKPNTTYAQGMPKEFSQKTKYDFPLPVFGHLSEQPIRNREILCAPHMKVNQEGVVQPLTVDPTASTYNNAIWGYRPIYDEYRDSWNQVSGLLKKGYYYKSEAEPEVVEYNLYNWTETRYFSRKDGERPRLNDDFLKCTIDNRNYSITDASRDRAQFLVAYEQEAHYWRPLTLLGTPGRIDHIL